MNTPPSIGFQESQAGLLFQTRNPAEKETRLSFLESSVTHKSAIVTGATSGLGRATALRLARDGFQILAVGRDADALASVTADIKAAGGTAASCVADVTSDDAPQRIVDAALAACGGIDALVNAAGIIASGSVMDTTDDGWDTMMNINVRAPFRLLRQAAPSLIARKGAVVNVSSVAGLRAFPGIASYAVSKAAVDQLTRVAALDLAPHGVRVNAVNPGVVVTNLHRRGGMDQANTPNSSRSRGPRIPWAARGRRKRSPISSRFFCRRPRHG